MARAQTAAGKKVGILMLAARRNQDLSYSRTGPLATGTRTEHQAESQRGIRPLDAGAAGRQGDAARAVACRHWLGDLTIVRRISATWSSSRFCATSKRTGPDFDLASHPRRLSRARNAEAKPWVAKHSEITSTSCRPWPRSQPRRAPRRIRRAPVLNRTVLATWVVPTTVPLPHCVPMAPLSRFEED